VPIVRATGGLDDSVEPFDLEHGTGTGFKFTEYSGEALLYAVRQALHHYMDERIWKRIQLNGMAKDFSWNQPAREYAKLYQAARVARGLNEIVQSPVKAAVPATAKGEPQASTKAEAAAPAKAEAQTPAKGAGPGGRNQKPVASSN
jgi:hypothetical protein